MSKKEELYSQCRLRRGNVVTVTYLPVRYAVEGNYVKLKKRNEKEWVNGWLVESVGEPKKSSQVMEKERDYLSQREASDV